MSNNLTKRHIVQKIYEQGDYKHDDVRDIVQKTLDIYAGGNLPKAKILNFENSVFSNYRLGNHALEETLTNRRQM